MSNDRVYCCNKEATCNNYERSELVFFEQVKFEKGFVWEKWKTSGICWIFLLSGEAGVSIEDEVVFVEAGEMFLLPALKGKLKAFTPLEFLYFISDRPTEYCLKTVSGRWVRGTFRFVCQPAAERICGNVDRVPGRWGGLQVFVRRKTGRTICFDEVLLL